MTSKNPKELKTILKHYKVTENDRFAFGAMGTGAHGLFNYIAELPYVQLRPSKEWYQAVEEFAILWIQSLKLLDKKHKGDKNKEHSITRTHRLKGDAHLLAKMIRDGDIFTAK